MGRIAGTSIWSAAKLVDRSILARPCFKVRTVRLFQARKWFIERSKIAMGGEILASRSVPLLLLCCVP